MTIRPTLVTFTWDAVPGATAYDILRNGVKVSTKAWKPGVTPVLKTQVRVLEGDNRYSVRAVGVTADVQSLDIHDHPS